MHEFDLSDPDQRNEAAAEYVLGTLDRQQKASFEALLAVSHDAQQEVEQWREHLDIFNANLKPVIPPGDIWQRINAETKPKKGFSLWSWQPLAALSLVLVMAVGILFQQTTDAENVYVYLIKNEQQQPGWMLNTSMEENELVVESLRHVSMPENTFYELWLMLEGQEPVTLGFLPAKGEKRIHIDPKWMPHLKDSEIVVTMEGPQGAPNGYDMGPVSDKARWKTLQF
ncbi:MAG: anti-sigma factor [Motiliproteus sp.]